MNRFRVSTVVKSIATAALAIGWLGAGAQEISGPVGNELGDPGGGDAEQGTQIPDYEQANVPVEMAVGIRQLGAGALGDTISPENGSLTFRHVDVSLPTNSGLPLEFARMHTLDGVLTQSSMGRWTIDLPYVTTRISDQQGWQANRCSGPDMRPDYTADGYDNPGNEATRRIEDQTWAGVRMFIPGQGGRLVLEDIDNTTVPGASQLWGNNIPPRATSDHWRIDCLNSVQNPVGVASGEGFLATSPAGVKYYFDIVRLSSGSNLPISGGGGCSDPLCELNGDDIVPTSHFNIFASRVEDVNGNWVKYEYGSAGLTRIHSNDGQEITVQRTGSVITSVTANGRVWSYEYDGGYSRLVKVTLPDSTFWEFDLEPQRGFQPGYKCFDAVQPAFSPTSASQIERVKHPNGIQGEFGVRIIRLGRTNVPDDETPSQFRPNDFLNNQVCNDFEDPSFNRSKGVAFKRLIVPVESGTETYEWTYSYQQDNGTRQTNGNPTPTGATDLRKTIITDPTGARDELYFNRRFNDPLEGKQIMSKRYSSGGTLLQSSDYEYIQGPDMGSDGLAITRRAPRVYEVHKSRSDMTVDGETYTTTMAYNLNLSSTNYSFGRPTNTTSFSTLQTPQRVTTQSYIHRKTPWVVGLPYIQKRNGVEFNRLSYDSLGRVTRLRKFGITMADLTYHTTGDEVGKIHTVTDAINRVTTFNNYDAGVAESIIRPDGRTVSRIVDDNGWTTSQTDARGNTTSYQYDQMGRLTDITRPGSLLPTVITYPLLNAGLTQIATTGSTRNTTFYDGMLRPYLTKAEAISGGGDTIYTRTGYDELSRTVFSSFPSETATASAGTETYYDDLSRPIRTIETVTDPETGVAVETFTTYLSGNIIETIDGEGNKTRTTRSGYGSANDGNPLRIDQFEGAGGTALISTLMGYDIYGNLLTATQDGITQNWSYDNRYRVCAHTTPETGTKRYEYDDANQMKAYAEAQSPGCGTLSASNRIAQSYDNLGRVTLRDYPTGTEDVSYTYDFDSNVLTNSRGTTLWTYAYDANNLLLSETLDVDSRTYATSYTYNGNGFLTALNPPSGRNYTYNIDGFGRQTRVREDGINRSGGARYHINGQLELFNYGNGYTYRSTLTPRQQTLRAFVRRDGTSDFVTDFTYDYDLNGRIIEIDDAVDPNEDRSFGYDGVNRLISADGPWGNIAYAYDGRNNLLSKTFTDGGINTRTVNLLYNSSNRLFRYNDTLTTGGSNRNVAYDNRGNVRNNGRNVLDHDLANQPISSPGGEAFVYDGNYKRVKQKINGETIYTVYSTSGSILIRDNITTGEVTDYVRLGGMTVAELKNGVPEYLYTDHLGTPVAGADQSRNILWRDSRLPYGEKAAPTPLRDNAVGYTGHIEDDDLALVYMQARYYDPVLGRFMSNDPVGFAEGGVGYFNRYAYTSNNPINAVDPDGEFWNIVAGAAIGAVVNAGLYAYESTKEGNFTLAGLGANALEGGIVGGIAATGNVGAALQAGAYANLTERLVTTAAEDAVHGNGAMDRYTGGSSSETGSLINGTLTMAGDAALGAASGVVGAFSSKAAPAATNVIDDIAGNAADDVVTKSGREAIVGESMSQGANGVLNDVIEKEKNSR